MALAFSACTSSSGGSGGGGSSDQVTATPGKGKITIEWDHSSAESYTLEYANADGAEAAAPRQIAISGAISGVTSPYEHDYLIYGETYTYTVRALDASGNSSNVGTANATPDRLPIADVEFVHDNFETCITSSIADGGENEGAEFVDEIDQLTNFGGGTAEPGGCYSASVEDLGGVEWLTSVTEMDASINTIGDVSPLSSLLLMESLDLSDNQVSTGASALLNLKNLTSLNVTDNESDLPCADLQALLDEFGSDVVDPDDTGAGNCFSGT